MRTAEQPGVQHARQEQVVGESRNAGDFGGRVDLADRLPDHAKGGRLLSTGTHTGSPAPARPAPPACAPPPVPPPRRSSSIPCSGTGCPTARSEERRVGKEWRARGG